MSDCQNVYQIFLLIQKLDHIFHSKLCLHCYQKVFSQFFCVTSAYKDPVENQDMLKILDKLVTGFFVVTLGILWYCSSKYQVIPNHYTIIIYDVFGKQSKINGIRTNFKTREVAQSYISEYQKRFPFLDFSMALEPLDIKSTNFRILKKIKDNVFSYEH